MEQTRTVGYLYKDAIRKLSGGWGMWSWNACCYLKKEEFPMWNRICETSFKNQDPDGPVHMTFKWLNNYFNSDGGADYVNSTLESLQNIGYISVENLDKYVDVWINFDNVDLANKYVGKDRNYAQILRKMCALGGEHGFEIDKNISRITPDELKMARQLSDRRA